MAVVRAYRSFPIDPPTPSQFKDRDVEWFPAVQVRVWRKHEKPTKKLLAIADTGSSFCLFQASIGRAIGLDVASGEKYPISGVAAGAQLTAYFHRISMSIEDNWTVDVYAGFLEGFSVGALLGRRGFFDTFSVRFDHSRYPPQFEMEKILKPN